MKSFLFVIIFFLFQSASAADLKIIQSHEKKIQPENEQHYLMSIGMGEKGSSYEVQSSQIEESAFWNAMGNPPTSVNEAIETAFKYHKKSRDDESLRIKEVALRPSASHGKTGPIWYYYIEIAEYPHDPGFKQYFSVILVSGEVVEPFYYAK